MGGLVGGFLLACGLRFGACDAGVLDFRLRFGWFGCQLLVFGGMLFEVGFGVVAVVGVRASVCSFGRVVCFGGFAWVLCGGRLNWCFGWFGCDLVLTLRWL